MATGNLNRGLKPTGRVMLLIMLLAFFILFVITGVKFAEIAHTGYVGDRDLLEIALRNQVNTQLVSSRRGAILDRFGNVLASQHPSYTLFANFHPDWGTFVAIEDVYETAEALATMIDMDEAQIVEILNRRQLQVTITDEDDEQEEYETMPLWVAEFGNAGRRLTFGQKRRIQELELPGIHFREDLTRFYPNGEFASHTIGYTIFEDDGIRGVMGIEGFFNEQLTARDGYFQFQHDRFGILQPGEQRHYIVPPLDGYEIWLTIDEAIQVFLETALDEMVAEAAPNHVVAVVMDARTGEILAVGNRPTFNPNLRNPETYANPLVYPLEPGSTMKIFTYAAAINEGRYQGNRTFQSGSRQLYNETINDHPLIPSAVRTFDEGFFISTNTSIIDLLSDTISLARFMDYLADFGFGATTGLPLYNEHPGLLPNFAESPVNVFVAGFGQGLSVTPIQMLQAMTATLNDGEMIRPQLISRIYDPNTNTVIEQFEREVIGQPITAETARQMRELMVGVIEDDMGTGRVHYRLNVPSGGKTGTAQVPNFAGPTPYREDVHIYSYIGFAPADDPEIIMFIAMERDIQPFISGHPYVGNLYRFVMNNTLSYLGLGQDYLIGGTDFPQVERVEMPRIFNLLVEEAVSTVEALDLIPIVIGDGLEVFNQYPSATSLVRVGDKVFIQTSVYDQLPDFTGWSRAEIFQYGRVMNLDITINGRGFGARQSIRPGRLVKAEDALTVTLE